MHDSASGASTPTFCGRHDPGARHAGQYTSICSVFERVLRHRPAAPSRPRCLDGGLPAARAARHLPVERSWKRTGVAQGSSSDKRERDMEATTFGFERPYRVVLFVYRFDR